MFAHLEKNVDSLFPQYDNHPARHPGWKARKSGIETWTCQRCGKQCTRPATKGQRPRYCSAACRDKHTPDERTSKCAVCGKPARYDATYCSLKCSAQANPQSAKKPRPVVLYTGPYTPPTRSIIIVRTKHRLTSGQCRVCSNWFVSFSLDVTCSSECWEAKRREDNYIHKALRRARKKAAFVENVYRKRVYESDGYRCHICNRMTRPDKQAPHPKSPTIDHIIPLANGGTHEPLNCRTAHYLCNVRKSNGGGGEQFILV